MSSAGLLELVVALGMDLVGAAFEHVLGGDVADGGVEPDLVVVGDEPAGRRGITIDILEDEVTLPLQAYTLSNIECERAYNHDAATRVAVGDIVTLGRTLPAGSYAVRTHQTLGRLAMHLLEPESPDNVVYWNTMDAWLPKAVLERRAGQACDAAEAGAVSTDGASAHREAPLIAIFKLMERRPLPTRLFKQRVTPPPKPRPAHSSCRSSCPAAIPP